MNNFRFLLAFSMFVLGITSYAQLPLNGTYTIDATGTGDYTSFNAAAGDLVSYGVDGAVVFNVAPGNYNEQLSIPEITGASSVNTIQFIGDAADSLMVVLSYAQTAFPSNYVLKLDGADYLTFQNMTIQSAGAFYSKVIVLDNQASYNTFSNNHIVGPVVSFSYEDNAVISSSTSIDSYNKIINNSILNGSYGVSFKGSSSSNEYNNLISGNLISGFYYHGIRADYQYNLELNNNELESALACNTYLYGIYVKYMDGSSEILGNKVNVRGTDYITGIRTDFSDGSSVNPILIANNFVAQTGSNNDVVRGLFIYHGSNLNICYNSINVTGGDANDGRAMYFTTYGSSYTGNIRVKNNIAVNSGLGVAMYVTYNAASDNMIVECDYNNYYVSGSVLTKHSGISEATLSDWQNASGWDSNSFNMDPLYASPSDLHINNYSLNASGTAITQVSTDIDGDARDLSNPDIGADEFSLPAALNGSYTIDQNGLGDYLSFTEAVSNLLVLGVDGPVIFNVSPGTYNERLVLTEVAGTSANNSITFQAANGDSTSVILTNNVLSSSENYTLKFDGADYYSFNKISITTDVAWTYCRVVEFANTAIGNSITNCVLTTHAFDSNSTDFSVIYSGASNDDSTRIMNNFISGGSYGIYMKGSSQFNPETGVLVHGNQIVDFSYRGILIHFHEDATVTNNVLVSNESTDTYSYVYGVWAGFVDDASNISANAIHVKGYDKNYGLYLNYCDGTVAQPMHIFNNSIVVGGTSTATVYGIHSFSGSHQLIYYNSVNILSGNTTSSAAIYLTCLSTVNNAGVELINNSFSNTSGGHSIYVTNTALTNAYITNSDYNNFYFTGSQLGKLGNFDPADLANWQLMSAWDSHSISSDPGYLQNNDLHISAGSALIGAGLNLALVNTDIDGDVRNPNNPCIGADELAGLVQPSDTQWVDFAQGWSIFSTYIQPDNPAFNDVFAAVINHVMIMKDDNGLVFWPPFVALLDTFTIGEGYNAKLDSALTVPLIGTAVAPENTSVLLPAGWSMFAYLRQSSGLLVDMLPSIASNVIIMKDGEGLIYWPQYGVNLIETLHPGKGYLVKLTASSTLVFPAN